MPVSRNDHHTQFSATPPSRTRFVTRFGVSVENVVATSEMPISHHGACRPAAKNSVMFRPARRASTIAGTNVTPSESTTITQSSVVKCMTRRVTARFAALLLPWPDMAAVCKRGSRKRRRT